jgi:CxxC-x17-CxxC domain-containing protein
LASLGEKSVVAFADKPLVCRECGTSFLFTAGEQEFYQQKGFTNEPGRCPSCRAARRSTLRTNVMSFEGDGDMGGGYSRMPREMHETTCASCGGTARVPFIPRGDRPVYCSNCFERERSYT